MQKYAALPIPDAFRSCGRIIAGDRPAPEILAMMKSLSDSNPDIGFYAFQTALPAGEAERESVWAAYAHREHTADPDVVEYAVEAAVGFFVQGES